MWAPWPLGSNRPIFWVLNASVIALVLGFFLAGEVGQGSRGTFDWRPAAAAGLTLFGIAVWMIFQTVGGVPAPLRHPVWSELAGQLDTSLAAVSANPGSTWAAIVEFIPAALLTIVA